MTKTSSPRWDPAGMYLYVIAKRHLDPIIGEIDFEAVFLETTRVEVIPLARSTPPKAVRAARNKPVTRWGLQLDMPLLHLEAA